MTEELAEAFKDMIKENTWMGNPSKRNVPSARVYREGYPVLEQKFLNMSKHILYDDIHLTDMKSLDTLYENGYPVIGSKFSKENPDKLVESIPLIPDRTLTVVLVLQLDMRLSMDSMMLYSYALVGRDFGEHTKEKWFREHYGEQFRQRAECYVRQYTTNVLCYDDGKVTSLNLTSNGKFTLRENIADNEGMKLAVKAYKAYQKKHGSESRFESMEDFDSDQMFFIGYATNIRMSVPHSYVQIHSHQ
ncbi:hypothetical protein NECAME_05743 [Necator americanus]|uniref:Peptidase M13 C-terminal domain-containing protein n=1 Tax=Necator americanus TaxID=51031 RepID=W2U124_NECAM|nr:hypothetical protein NECAME_05743 [Necator americanus]ETN87022.1 hypothetical protein NECAME_05743 [Necator americanus]